MERDADRDAAPDSPAGRYRMQPVFAVEFHVLQRVDDVETAAPCDNQPAEQDREHGQLSRYGDIGPDRGDSERHAQNDMAPGRKALGQAVPRENQQGDGRQSESQRIDPPCYQNEQHGVQHDEPQRVARGDRTRRNLAAARARVLRVDPPVGPTVESHSRVACQHHGQKHLDQYRPLERQTVGLQRVHVSDQCERKREYRMGKLDERRVARDGCETIHGNGVFYEFAKLTNFAYE